MNKRKLFKNKSIYVILTFVENIEMNLSIKTQKDNHKFLVSESLDQKLTSKELFLGPKRVDVIDALTAEMNSTTNALIGSWSYSLRNQSQPKSVLNLIRFY